MCTYLRTWRDKSCIGKLCQVYSVNINIYVLKKNYDHTSEDVPWRSYEDALIYRQKTYCCEIWNNPIGTSGRLFMK